jgi:hypothetical protein
MNNNIKVIKYDLLIDLDTTNFTYKGEVIIKIELLNNNNNNIKINYKELNIESLNINEINFYYKLDIKNQEIIVDVSELIDKNISILDLKFVFNNVINTDLEGLYYYNNNNELIISTQMEPIDARRVFPCFDQPDLKSKFNLTLIGPIDKIYLSNMPIITEIINNNRKIVKFDETPIMSTYLLAFVVGDIVKAQKDLIVESQMELYNDVKLNPEINVYSLNDISEHMTYAVKKSYNCIKYFEKWFGIPYILSKMDIVCIPNFGSGAMENWGLIMFKEEYLACPKNCLNLAKLKINEVIYHEIAHQWFGNLVSLKDWSSLWLNESFATIFAWNALSDIDPELYSEQWFYELEVKKCLFADGLDSTHSILVKIDNNAMIYDIFDEISYTKGSCLVNYLIDYCGYENFKKSINVYLNKYKYQNTTSEDLYVIIEEYSSKKDINKLINDLLHQSGYPIIYCNIENNKLILRKKKFNLIKKETEFENYDTNFYIKIRYMNTENKIIDEYIYFDREQIEYNLLNIKDDYIIINPDFKFFCLIKYNFKPNIKIMNYNDKIYYLDTIFIINNHDNHTFSNINNVIEISKEILFGINIEELKNIDEIYCLLHIFITNIIKIYDILELSNYLIELEKFNKLINNEFNLFFKRLLKIITLKPISKYTENLLDDLFIILCNYLKDEQMIKLSFKIFDKLYKKEENKDIIKSFRLNNSLFHILCKYNFKDYYKKINNINRKTNNIFIKNSSLFSLTMCRDKEILQKIVDDKFKNIKSHNFNIFLSNLSKNNTIDLINYIIVNKNKFNNLHNKLFISFLKGISHNYYTVDKINKIKLLINNILKQSENSDHTIVIFKIKEILKYNNKISKVLKNKFNN